MKQVLLFPYGQTKALTYACRQLQKLGFLLADKPSQQVTHLLLPVPAFDANGHVKGTGALDPILSQLPADIAVIGGKLSCIPDRYQKIDLLEDEVYLAENAAITAHCALKLALAQLPCTLDNCPVLVVGWGRIGKCLARLLRQVGAKVTVAARKQTDQAMLNALGYDTLSPNLIDPDRYRVIFNTAPHPLLPNCPGHALKIDLASVAGITGADVIWARGLPNLDAPENSGILIAKHIADYFKKTEVLL